MKRGKSKIAVFVLLGLLFFQPVSAYSRARSWSITSAALDYFDNTKSALSAYLSDLPAAAADLSDTVRNLAFDASEQIASPLGSFFGAAKNAVFSAPRAIKDFVFSPSADFANLPNKEEQVFQPPISVSQNQENPAATDSISIETQVLQKRISNLNDELNKIKQSGLVISAPVIQEKIIEKTASGVSEQEFNAKIAEINSKINASSHAIALTNRINNISGATINNSTFTGTVHGLSLDYLSLTGGTLTGSLTGTSATFSSQLTVSGTATSTIAGDTNFDSGTLYIDSLNNRIGVASSSPSETFSLNGPAYFSQISAPSVTADRLYNTSGDLYWGGNLVGSASVGNWTLSGGNIYRSSGSVGIGTTSPYAKLSVEGSSALGNSALAGYFTATSTTATSTFAGGLAVETSGLVYDYSTGFVGIGTAAPVHELHIKNSSVDSVPALRIENDAQGYRLQVNGGDNDKFQMLETTDFNTFFSFRKSTLDLTLGVAGANTILNGNVGIGTTSPYAKLSVEGSSALGNSALAGYFTATSTTATSTFSTGGLTVGASQFVVQQNSGNIGIGTTTPGGLLSVVGTPSASATSALLQLTGTNNFSGGHSSGQFLGINSPSGYTGNLMTLATDGTTRVEVRSSGSFIVAPNAAGGSSSAFTAGGSSVSFWDLTTLNSAIDRVTISPSGLANSSDIMGMFNVSIPDSTTGTGGWTGIRVNRTGSGTGSGDKRLIDLQLAGVSQFIVNNSGNVGVGTTSPYSQLSIHRSSLDTVYNPIFTVASSTATASTTLFTISNGGFVGVGTSSPKYNLSVQSSSEGDMFQLYDTDGNCRQDPDSGGITTTCSSDLRLKTDITETASVLDYFLGLPIKDYTVIASGDRFTGVIAQELLEKYPELVVMGEDGYYGVKEIGSWKVIKAIQELNLKIEGLMASSSQPLVGNQTIISQSFDWILEQFRNIGIAISDGVITAKEFVADKITTKELCVEDVCVGRNQLKELLEKNSILPAGQADSPPPPAPAPASDDVNNDETILPTGQAGATTPTTPVENNLPNDNSVAEPAEPAPEPESSPESTTIAESEPESVPAPEPEPATESESNPELP